MGLSDWFRRKKHGEEPAGARAQPEIVGSWGDDSIMIAVQVGNGPVMIMDRDMYDYQYGESKRPAPAQRDLDALLPKVTRVRAVSGGLFRGAALPSAVLLDTSEPDAIAALRACLQIVEDPRTHSHCGCLGGPTLELFGGPDPEAAIGLQHGGAIRWAAWQHDAPLLDGPRLDAWLTHHGVDPALLQMLYQNPFGLSGGRIEGASPEPLSRSRQRLFLARILSERGNHDEALGVCDAVVADEPNLGEAYATRGSVRDSRGEVDSCLKDYSAAIDLGYRDADVYFRRAVALDNLGLPLDAVADCTAAIALDPHHANAYHSRAVVRIKLGELEAARDDLDAAIAQCPDAASPYANRAQLAQSLGDNVAAVADYTRALERLRANPKEAPPSMLARLHWNRGMAYESVGDQTHAGEDSREAVRLDPTLDQP